MALFRKPSPSAPPEPPPPAEPPPPPPTRRFTDTSPDQLTLLGATLHVVGEISGEDAVVIGGKFEGQITTSALFQLAESGSVSGSVRSANAALAGELTGMLEASGKIELGSTSRVRATLRAPAVAMAEGSFFDGEVHMTEGGSPQAFQEKRAPR